MKTQGNHLKEGAAGEGVAEVVEVEMARARSCSLRTVAVAILHAVAGQGQTKRPQAYCPMKPYWKQPSAIYAQVREGHGKVRAEWTFSYCMAVIKVSTCGTSVSSHVTQHSILSMFGGALRRETQQMPLSTATPWRLAVPTRGRLKRNSSPS